MGFMKSLLIENNFQITPAMRNLVKESQQKEKEMCPICGLRPPYSVTRTVKLGNFDGRRFHTTGTEERTDNWWACKECSEHTSIDEYVKRMIEFYNNLDLKIIN